MTEQNMNRHHRINVWRIAGCCPVCGSDRDYSPANPGGIECYCSNDDCGYSEFFPNGFIHNYGTKNDNTRFEVLDSNNKIKAGWCYRPNERERKLMGLRVKECKLEKEQREKDKNKIYANLGDIVYCRKKSAELNIKNCDGCSFCEEHGIEENGLEFSKCTHPLETIAEFRSSKQGAGDPR